MIINDKVYGREEINEPVLIDLINCDSVQRLKGISQMGMPQEYYHKPVYSRYDHSVGVLILLKKLGANLNEQIAGLLHDISHTCFSHVIDWVVGDSTKEDYQDNIFSEFLELSEIPFILKKYKLNYQDFLDLENFSLLEQHAPALCADRFDYSIREISWINDKNFIKEIINNLINYKGKLIFISKDAAENFSKGYLHCQVEHWAGNEAKARYYILSQILKKAINEKIISLNDLKKFRDEDILNILIKKGDEFILENLNLLKKGFRVIETESEEGIFLKKKFRYVNPEILINGILVTLSEVSLDYAKTLEKIKQESEINKKILILK